jgi:hypothetical protein
MLDAMKKHKAKVTRAKNKLAKVRGAEAQKNASKYTVTDLNKFKNTDLSEKFWRDYKDEAEKYLYAIQGDDYQAVRSYTGSGYDRINDYLRTGTMGHRSYSVSETKDQIKRLDKVLDGLPPMPENAKVYRRVTRTKDVADQLFGSNDEYLKAIRSGLDDAEMTKNLRALAKGRTYTEPGYSSAAAQGFNWSGNINIEIYVPKGSRVGGLVDPISSCKGEREFLIRRGQKFQIIDIKATKDNWGVTETTLKVVVIE